MHMDLMYREKNLSLSLGSIMDRARDSIRINNERVKLYIYSAQSKMYIMHQLETCAQQWKNSHTGQQIARLLLTLAINLRANIAGFAVPVVADRVVK